MTEHSLPLDKYLDILEGLCRPFDRNSLLQCILALAKQVKPEDRGVFLENFRSLLPDSREMALPAEELLLLSEMAAMKKAIENRLRALKGLAALETEEKEADPSTDRRLLH